MKKLMKKLFFVLIVVFFWGCNGNVVMNYHMDECKLNDTNKTVKDYSDTQNDAVSKYSKGRHALAYPGTNEVVCGYLEFFGSQYLEADDKDEISPFAENNEMTMSGWFKISKINGTLTIISKLNEYRVFIENGNLKVTIWDGTYNHLKRLKPN